MSLFPWWVEPSGGFPIAARGFQQLPQRFQALVGPKLRVPRTKAFRGEKNSPRRGHSGTKQMTYRHIEGQAQNHLPLNHVLVDLGDLNFHHKSITWTKQLNSARFTFPDQY